MSKVGIVTDSTADMPAGVIEEFGIKVVPLTVRFGTEEFLDKVELTIQQFYQKLETCTEITHPATSQPSPEAFLAAIQELDTDQIICINIAENLSGTTQSARRPQERLPSHDIRVIDSQTTSLGLGFLVEEAAQMATQGKTLDEIEQEILRMVPKVRVFALLDTLKYLERGGRIGKASYWLGALLNFKPIIKVEKGEVLPVSRPRTRSKGIDELVRVFAAEGKMKRVGVIHATAQEEALNIADTLSRYYPGEIPLAELGPVLGTHAGPGAIGICGILK